ncbi:MAG: SDR family NAD(P)-dependent oxidoreductase [Candidatus Omnitrophota bacterium]|nr:SDR family NAD(P)-dependent oxidoreductase [Candidatus Omnitrophota bacterium]
MEGWEGKRVLVTGAGGFIGSHLTERLVRLGARTRAFVHYRGNGSWGWLDHSEVKGEVEVAAGDIRDRDLVARAMQEVEIVFHLAALVGIPYSYHAPASYVQTNVEGTLNVLQTGLERRIERLIHTSTSEVYGSARYIPIDEAHPLNAQSPYAASKIGADKLVESFGHSYGLPAVTVRPFNTFGPRQSARAVVPTIIMQCLTGDVVRLGNVSPTRDLNYVSDIVEGFIRAAVAADAVGQTINLGSGCETSIEELAKTVAGLTGKSVVIECQEERTRPTHSEVERLVADNTAARRLLGWAPSIPLEEGLKMTMEWIREHLDGYRQGVYAL